MKLVTHYLESIAGVEIFPLISFILFFLMFLSVIYLVIKADNQHMKKMAAFPLEADDRDPDAENNSDNTN